LAHFDKLRAGRALPAGFKGWDKERRLAWLERNWSLGKGE
jgi:hypothetical protein